jgi:hypothetical protein
MKKMNQPLIMIKIGVVWFYFFALIAHFFAPEGYSIINNNFSQLGPQGYALAWVMQIAYIGSAILWLYGLYLNYKHPVLHTNVAVMFVFIALFIVVAGLFKTTLPGILLPDPEAASLERNIHLFAAHGSQVLGLIILIEHVKNATGPMKKNHIIILIALIFLSILFEFGPYLGLSQRVLALTHSFWSLKYLNRYQ